MPNEVSALGPIDPASVSKADETEKEAPWVMRKLVGSMTGRIVLSSYESLRAAGTSVICLSPWGDSSPLLLPCIRFRDLVIHTVIAVTGGMAAVAAPVMGPATEVAVASFGDSILVELGVDAGFNVTTAVANDLVFNKPINKLVPIHSKRLETTGVKVLTITIKFKLTREDAALGFYRSSIHEDTSLFSTVKDYLAIEKGWFSPYLFATARRPIIPRSIKPDVIFCHGPFLSGDYRVGQTLLSESASVITLCNEPATPEIATGQEEKKSAGPNLSLPSLSNLLNRSRTPSPEPALAPLIPPPTPRRMVILVVGLKPHRQLWTTSKRPGESVLQYVLLNGCISIVVPVKTGAPLVAWDALTLEQLWKVDLPISEEAETAPSGKFEGVVNTIFEYLDLCVDWERVTLPSADPGNPPVGRGADGFAKQKEALKDATTLLVAAAIRSKDSKEVRKEVDKERSGIAMWRIP